MLWIMHEGLCLYIFYVEACEIMNRYENWLEGTATADEFFNKTDNYFCLGSETRVACAL